MKQTWELLGSATIRYAMLVIVMILAGTFFSESASAVTIVFVHGKGSGKDTVDGVTNNYWTQDMIRATTRNYTVPYVVCTYDGRLNYWDSARDVAAQVNTALDQGKRDLVFVCHSMGGLVTRFILCNADASDPYYNYNGNYNRIQANTRHVMTLATPHKGSEAADLAGTLNSTVFTSWIVSLVDGNVDSTRKLTTAHLQYASTQWLRDGLRSKAFYTLAGTGLWNDFCLECVGLATLSGLAGLPGEDDGLVAQYSAHAPGAPGGDWYNTDANHHYNRRNSYRTIGTYLAQSGGY
ncbi:MAG: hypothetical protein K1Y36_29715 [Blastocatellia bacterium]|nr:hypothetical protein [Blastocatellia bacterium]